MTTVEIYYGYYLGDAQMWDTVDISIGDESTDPETDALNYFHENMLPKIPHAVAFFNVYGVGDEEEIEDDGLDED